MKNELRETNIIRIPRALPQETNQKDARIEMVGLPVSWLVVACILKVVFICRWLLYRFKTPRWTGILRYTWHSMIESRKSRKMWRAWKVCHAIDLDVKILYIYRKYLEQHLKVPSMNISWTSLHRHRRLLVHEKIIIPVWHKWFICVCFDIHFVNSIIHLISERW